MKRAIDPIALRNTVLFALLLGVVVHGYNLFNMEYNNDSLVSINQQVDDVEWKVALGRFVQPMVMFLRGYHAIPLVTGVLSLLYMGVAIYFMTLTLGIERAVSRYLLVALFVTSYPYSLAHLSYLHELDMFMLALLSATLAVYLLRYLRYGYLWGVFLITLCCGLYQAYLSIAIVMIMLLVINSIISHQSLRSTLTLALKGLGMLLIGGGCYALLYRGIAHWCGVALAGADSSYNSMDHLYQGKSLATLLLTYREFAIDTLFPLRKFRWIASGCLTLPLVGYVVVRVAQRLRAQHTSRWSIALLLLVVALLPLGSHTTTFLSGGVNYGLMSMGATMLFAGVLMLLEGERHTSLWRSFATYIAIPIVVFNGFIYANDAYQERAFKVQESHVVMQRLYDDLMDTPAFAAQERPTVLLVGDINYLPSLHYPHHLYGIVSYGQCYESYFRNYFNCELHIVADAPTAQQREAIALLPCYPHRGYIVPIDGVVVVKFPTEPQSTTTR